MKYNTLGEFLKNFISTRELTLEYVAAKTNKTKSSISQYISGTKNPSKDFIDSFLEAFKLTKEEREDFLLVAELGKTVYLKEEIKKYVKKDSSKEPSNVTDEVFESFVTIPLYGMASAGNGLIESEESNIEYINIPKLNGNVKKSDFATRVKGDSMEPYYHNGDIIVVDVSNQDIRTLNGKEALIYYDDNKYLKLVYFEPGTGNLFLRSYNVAYSDIKVENKEVETLSCKGTVSMVISMRNRKSI